MRLQQQIETANWWLNRTYAFAVLMAATCPNHSDAVGVYCDRCRRHWNNVEAFALWIDAWTAERLAGRRPRGWLRREVPV